MKEMRSFGPNEWLIDDMYRRFRDDPESVSEAWRDFFDGYRSPTQEIPVQATKPTQATSPADPTDADASPLTGADAVIAQRMTESLMVPTATSVRSVPAKLLEVNRSILNNHLARARGGKVSFTHLIGWAVIKALTLIEEMNASYVEVEGKPHVTKHPDINLGLAVDVRRPDGSRTLMVPNIKAANRMSFASFYAAYEELILKVGAKKLVPDDFASTTVTITNPGMIGTVQSIPRLMAGQAAIVGVGSIAYPAEYEGSDPQTLAAIGIGKVLTLTSTYDHRVIQGATSGEFLAKLHDLLLGDSDFYDEIFSAMGVPYVPARWRRDVNPEEESLEADQKQARVWSLINMYRVRGHLIADLDPLDARPPVMPAELDPAHHGLSIWDLDRSFVTGGIAGKDRRSLGEVLGILRDAYCRTSTVEYMHISDHVQKEWIQARVEGVDNVLAPEHQRHVLSKLNQAEAFEAFLHRKYVGHKRFSLEGAESLIPILDDILDAAASSGIEEVVVGMAHRGRLNVLANIIGKSYAEIFRQFEGDIDPTSSQGSGDVKYHLGASGRYSGRNGKSVPVSVAPNPSHLEAVDPVVEGMVRAKQDLLDRGVETPVLPLLIHGDAAFAGQGVVAETLNLSQLSGYRTGGTVHVIVNNQLGFTTGSDYGRSTTYASDVGKMVQAPIFHVNGDDPEACVRVARLAFEFRQAFKKDVIIDMWCYRRWGHNEADEPAFTQPLMFSRIEGRRSVRKLFTETLVNRGDLSIEEAEASLEEFRATLDQAFADTKAQASGERPVARPAAERPVPNVETAVDKSSLEQVLEAISSTPTGFDVHPKLRKWLGSRAEAIAKGAIDWSLGEALALGTLLSEGITIRLTGQDTRRGTFSQRHATLVDQTNGSEYTPLAKLASDGARFFTYDSLLSEFAALGFEYGYSVARPDALVIWEAQFGDFANGAQVIIDQFIAASQDKWGVKSGLVMFLPHGYEGQGPEHSSARLERFVQLAADSNMSVAVPSTPAQMFHLLRRQAYLGEDRTPLIVMTPKSFLRLPLARSAPIGFTEGSFQPVLPDPDGGDTLLLCAGKIYYDLVAHKKSAGFDTFAIARLEQIYPFPEKELREAIGERSKVRWVQEESENMGAWSAVQDRVTRMGIAIEAVTRPPSASPAAGSTKMHEREHQELLEKAFS